MRNHLERDEEAISSTVATVLLFGGVISIIGIMMTSMLPVINELEGSIERNDMASQMKLLAQRVDELSQSGMPGDSKSAELHTVDGTLGWDYTNAGMWYSAAWHEDISIRTDGLTSFSDTFRLRHAENQVSTICLSDLRLGQDRTWNYEIPDYSENLVFSVKSGITIPLGPTEVELYSNSEIIDTISLLIDDTVSLDLSNKEITEVRSESQLNILSLTGNSGSTILRPDDSNSLTGLGESWTIPLPAGTSTIHVASTESNKISLRLNEQDTTVFAIKSSQTNVGSSHSFELNLSDAQTAYISTSFDSQVSLHVGELGGKFMIPSLNKLFSGSNYIVPDLPGYLTFTNPSEISSTATWRGDGITLSPKESRTITWPPSGMENSGIINSENRILLQWSASTDNTGISLIPGADTMASSGKSFMLNLENSTDSEYFSIYQAGWESIWETDSENNLSGMFEEFEDRTMQLTLEQDGWINVTDGHSLKVTHVNGDDGLIQLQENGDRRCEYLGVTASGWILSDLPWQEQAGKQPAEIKRAWKEGHHPSSIHLEVFANHDAEEFNSVGSVWAFHISRLTYSFSSSIEGMEVAYSSGAVVTNHPEFEPFLIHPPSDRGGPGPRFAATVPAMHPAANTLEGGGSMSLDIEMSNRFSLSSTTAYEIRRGWTGPYGEAVTQVGTEGLESSEDWIIYPNRLDLLTDYVGWVPDPGLGTTEAVWHTGGGAVQFTLQCAELDVYTEEVSR